MTQWIAGVIFFAGAIAMIGWGSTLNGKDYHENKNYQDEKGEFLSEGSDVHTNKNYQEIKKSELQVVAYE
jgi:hypothetical protein